MDRRFAKAACVLASFLCLASGGKAWSASPETVALTVQINDMAQFKSGELAGEVTFPPLPTSERERCFYLPYEDSEYEWDPARGFTPSVLKYGHVERQRGWLKVSGPAGLRKRRADIVAVPANRNESVTLAFHARLPRWPDRYGDRWLYNDFYPQPLAACPKLEDASIDLPLIVRQEFVVDLAWPKGLQIATPAVPKSTAEDGKPGSLQVTQEFTFTGSKFAFAMAASRREHVIQIGETKVTAIYHTDYFEDFLPAIGAFMTRLTAVLGPFPLPKLVIIETDDLEKSRIPGIVTINRPKYTNTIQERASGVHWTQWQLAYFLAEQWSGVITSPAEAKDDWFLRGTADFLTYLVLAEEKPYFNFFAARRQSPPFFDFTYRQATDAMAAVLTYTHPANNLVNHNLESAYPFASQHPLNYVRQSLAMRSLNWQVGPPRWQSLIRAFFERHRFARITPKAFYDFLRAQGEGEAAQVLKNWWVSDSWPDFTLLDVETKPASEGHTVTVTLNQNPAFQMPVDVLVEGEKGEQQKVRAVRQDKVWVAEAQLKTPLKRVDIHPDREVFDWNRFNNNNQGLNLEFFPGSARTFRDDAYTVLWLPLLSKLPGENLTFMLASQVFRYLHNSFTNFLAYVPNERRFGFHGIYLSDIPDWSVYTILNVTQNFGNTSKGERIIDGSVYRRQFFLRDPDLEVGGLLRYREVLGQPDSRHATFTARLQLQPPNPYRCHYGLNSDFEMSIPNDNAFRYRKDTYEFSGNCRVWDLNLEGRLFYGRLSAHGTPPGNVAFQPQDLDGPRLRIDSPRLDPVNQIATAAIDILGPMRLPLDSFLLSLPRESRWRLFYDYGKSLIPTNTYRDAGVGFFLPFGSDVVGKKSMAFLRLSTLVVLYRSHDGEVSRKPGVLVDLLGKL